MPTTRPARTWTRFEHEGHCGSGDTRGHDAGFAVPCREGPGHRATVSHMGSRHSSATNLVQMQSADMARYMPSTGPALVGDRCAHALPPKSLPGVALRSQCTVVDVSVAPAPRQD